MGLSYSTFTMLRYVIFPLHILNFVKGLFYSYWNDFVFKYICIIYHIYWLLYAEPFLNLWDKPNLIMVNNLFFYFYFPFFLNLTYKVGSFLRVFTILGFCYLISMNSYIFWSSFTIGLCSDMWYILKKCPWAFFLKCVFYSVWVKYPVDIC